ncbi:MULTISPECIES: class I SAM-dependent methyltransferase [unclassified Bacillus (in: firmicutes)]|uniref:class I SAM-dependent methyltransferase n=1 Tax=unclassified Bacillus (in: firmicutes) TaxID=185979 RepID=UPI001BE8A77B|nr:MULTISPECIES: class I SAM-dependent methyltransferase [unclassified Bacillus (in: firmicutes)]MBT2637951.1 class I SAM-dependent methyltransferase [Bacillus sp. ISL-39]MBT2661126.1 class I SAM-dependent methyltransferase [Bacillus sp. ISL-45]
MKETIHSYEDLLTMLDHLLKEESQFNWDNFYSDRERKVPFFENHPDENLVEYIEMKRLVAGKVLDLGCGPGRNAIYLARNGFQVDAVDQSSEGLEWAKEREKEQKVQVNFIQRNIFEMEIEEGTYDLVYDSGCFHHIPPHRRMNYIELVKRALKPGGLFALTCFVEGGELGGAAISDWEVYRGKSMRGGLGFTAEKLTRIFHEFTAVEIRKMSDMEHETKQFGNSALIAALFKKET